MEKVYDFLGSKVKILKIDDNYVHLYKNIDESLLLNVNKRKTNIFNKTYFYQFAR